MKRGNHSRKDQFKWLAALCICLLCVALCIGVLARPTLAASDTVKLTALSLVDSKQWTTAAPGNQTDSLGTVHAESIVAGGVYNETGVVSWARYQLGQKYGVFSGKLACAADSTEGAAVQLNLYADSDTVPIYTSPVITRAAQAVAFSVRVKGAAVLKLELISTAEPGVGEDNAKAFVLLADPKLDPLEIETTTETTTSAISTTGLSESSTSWGPTTAPVLPNYQYAAQEGYVGLYEMLDEQGKPLDHPRVYVFSYHEKPAEWHVRAYQQDGKYYVMLLKNDVYVALKPGKDVFDMNDVIWAGQDQEFDTVADNRVAVLRSGSYFYETETGVWKFLASRYDYNDYFLSKQVFPTTVPWASTSVTSSASEASSTSVAFFSTGYSDMMPKTGVPANVGLWACLAALFMGCIYCGYRILRKERA